MQNAIKDFFIRLRNDVANQNSELIWSQVWHDTIKGIPWAESIERLSPGRAAAGYNYLYVMTRILDELSPKKVLDIGLGISSTLISSYFSNVSSVDEPDAKHLVVEHDRSWIDFYSNKHKLSENSEIVQLDIVQKRQDGGCFMHTLNLKV